MVKVPCQEIVWDIIPAIQAALAAELVNLGVSQIQVAQSLSLAPSAVSQYLSGKRGYRIVLMMRSKMSSPNSPTRSNPGRSQMMSLKPNSA